MWQITKPFLICVFHEANRVCLTPGVGHTENKEIVKQNTNPSVFNSGDAWLDFTSRLK